MLADKIKRRLIVDCLRSGADDVATQWERILLPKVLDVIMDVLDLMGSPGTRQMALSVLDFSDAFYLLPLCPEELKYYVVKYRSQWIAYNRVVQGSKNGPQLFGRLFGDGDQADAGDHWPGRHPTEHLHG